MDGHVSENVKSVADTMYNRKVDELYEVISWMVVGHRYYTPSYVPDLRPHLC